MGEPPVSELMNRMGAALRSRRHGRRPEQAQCRWVKRFIRFHGVRHPVDRAAREINAFLTHLAVDANASAPTHTPALYAILFLYRRVIGREVGELSGPVRARTPRRRPVVLTRDEAMAVPSELDGDKWLMAAFLYGAALRLLEGLRLRILALELTRGDLIVRDGKGGKDHVTMLPLSLQPAPRRIWLLREPSTSTTSPTGGAALRCRRPLRASTRARRLTGAGNGSSRSSAPGRTHRRARRAAITPTRPSASAR